jgi:hypothetical protein
LALPCARKPAPFVGELALAVATATRLAMRAAASDILSNTPWFRTILTSS